MLELAGAHLFAKSSPSSVSVFATGLNNPRGLKFGPDGNLYVAEGGIGVANSTEGCCEQVIPPVGPTLAAPLARVFRRSMSTAFARPWWTIFPLVKRVPV
jgi:hypothetical protein